MQQASKLKVKEKITKIKFSKMQNNAHSIQNVKLCEQKQNKTQQIAAI